GQGVGPAPVLPRPGSDGSPPHDSAGRAFWRKGWPRSPAGRARRGLPAARRGHPRPLRSLAQPRLGPARRARQPLEGKTMRASTPLLWLSLVASTGLAASAAAETTGRWEQTYHVHHRPSVEIITNDGEVVVRTWDRPTVTVRVSTVGWPIGSGGVEVDGAQGGDEV